MDSFDTACLWITLSLPVAALLAFYLFRRRYNELIALHLVIFWAQFFPYGAFWLYHQEAVRFPISITLLLGFEVTLYCGVMLCAPFQRFAQTVSEAAREISPWWLLLWLAASTGGYLFIVGRYGALSLISRPDVAESAGLPSSLTYLNGLLAVPAWGAVFCCCVRRLHPIHLLAALYVLLHFLIDGGGGKREVLMVIAVIVLFRRQRPLRITWGFVASAASAACLIFMLWSYYENIRLNYPTAMMYGRYDSPLDMAKAILATPRGENLLQRNLEDREPPISLLERIVDSPKLGGGAFIEQAIANALPSRIRGGEFKHEDDVLRDALDFPEGDYPWTILTELQAEISVLAALVAPLIYFGMFWICWSVVGRWRGRSPMIVLVAIGIAVMEAGAAQTLLTWTFVHLRTLGIYLAMGFVWWHLFQARIVDRVSDGIRPRDSERPASGDALDVSRGGAVRANHHIA
jgi:hypothetical protein